jgi:hypothetical protein
MNNTIFYGIIVAVSLGLALLLFYLGQSKKKNAEKYFWSLISVSTIASAFYLYFISRFTVFEKIFVWLAILFVCERVLWSWTLKETSGRDLIGWFLIVYYLPIIGWILYRITRL